MPGQEETAVGPMTGLEEGAEDATLGRKRTLSVKGFCSLMIGRGRQLQAPLGLGTKVLKSFSLYSIQNQDLMMEDISIKAEPQESVLFEDVTVYFTEQELASLTLDQKALYKEVVLENLAHVAFLGYIAKLRKYAQLAGAEMSRVKAFL